MNDSSPDRLPGASRENPEKRSEAVNHPSHYGGDTPYEAIKVIEAWQLGFHLGNVLKYIRRAEHKDNRIQNLQKARWYLERYISGLEAAVPTPEPTATKDGGVRSAHPEDSHAAPEVQE
jgi:uncharacterized protein DUF3310